MRRACVAEGLRVMAVLMGLVMVAMTMTMVMTRRRMDTSLTVTTSTIISRLTTICWRR